VEWVVDAAGCDPEALRDATALEALFAAILDTARLTPVAPATWHRFPHTGGLTGVQVLAESHLACHTFPERGFAAFNLYCCRPREEWPWAERLRDALRAERVSVRRLVRGEP